MKKFRILLIIFVFSMIFTQLNNKNFELFNLYNHFKNSKYFVYAYDDINSLKVKCGNYYIYNQSNNKSYFKQKFAEELIINGNENIVKEILKMLNVKIEIIDKNFECNIYGYTTKLKSFLYINECKINIQIYLKNNTIKIGTPFIFGFM